MPVNVILVESWTKTLNWIYSFCCSRSIYKWQGELWAKKHRIKKIYPIFGKGVQILQERLIQILCKTSFEGLSVNVQLGSSKKISVLKFTPIIVTSVHFDLKIGSHRLNCKLLQEEEAWLERKRDEEFGRATSQYLEIISFILSATNRFKKVRRTFSS